MSDSTPPASSSFDLLKRLIKELLQLVEEVERMGSLIRLRPDLPPVWSLPSTLTIQAGQSIALEQYVEDPDNTQLTISVVSGALPVGVQLTGNLLYAATSSGNAEASITFEALDGFGNKATASTTLVVEATVSNTAPYWDGMPASISILVPATISLSQWARDANLGDTLTYALHGGVLPPPAVLDPATGNIVFPESYPSQTLSGLQFRITDSQGASAVSPTVSIAVGGAPVWTGPTSISLSAGQSLFVGGWFASSGGHTVVLSPLSAPLPQGVTLQNSGLICSDQAPSSVTPGIVLRAQGANGLVSDGPALSLSVSATVVSSPLAISQNNYFKLDTVYPPELYGTWNMGQIDNRGGLIMWSDGDHGPSDTSNSVRYYNYTGSDFHNIPAGEVGRLIPVASNADARVWEYDNYPYVYIKSENKFVFSTTFEGNSTETVGVFDMGANPPNWTYVSAPKAVQFGLPVWTEFMKNTTNAILTHNSPAAYCEPSDCIILTRKTDTSQTSNASVLIIDRNPLHNISETQPWRVRVVNVGTAATAPWASLQNNYTSEAGSQYNLFTNSGVCAGNWFYVVKMVPASVHLGYPDPTSIRFFRVNVSDIKNGIIPAQYEELQPIPSYFLISANRPHQGFHPDWQNVTMPSNGPLLSYDEDSNSIICLSHKLLAFDIDAKVWTDKAPAGYEGVRAVLGGWRRSQVDPSVREILYYGRVKVQFGDGAASGAEIITRTNVDPHTGQSRTESGQRHKWIGKLTLTGAKPRARQVPRTLSNNRGPSASTANPFAGKHVRFVYSRRWNLANPTNGLTGTPTPGNPVANGVAGPGKVFMFGGDFPGSPTNDATGYPPRTAGSQGWSLNSSRQDAYMASVQEVDGAVLVEMSNNFCAFYPYPEGPDPLTTPLGPPAPDGVGVIVDKRGDFWVGPGYSRFDSLSTNPPSSGPSWKGLFPMFRWRLPAEVNGTRHGNGWYQPPQNLLLPSDMARINPDDFLVSGSGAGGMSGVSNNWTAYDEKEDCVVVVARNNPQFMYKFMLNPALPVLASGATADPAVTYRFRWKRFALTRTNSLWYAFLNTQIKEGATPYSSGSPPATYFHGAHVIVRDHVYVTCSVSGGNDKRRRVGYITKWSLRDPAAEPEYIALPTHWVRGWDADTARGDANADAGSVTEFRDIQRLGHLIVLSPAYIEHLEQDPWLCWYNTNTGQWTLGQTYAQMRALDPTIAPIPDPNEMGVQDLKIQEYLNKGALCCVEETGEAWVQFALHMGGGMIKYRIW